MIFCCSYNHEKDEAFIAWKISLKLGFYCYLTCIEKSLFIGFFICDTRTFYCYETEAPSIKWPAECTNLLTFDFSKWLKGSITGGKAKSGH